MHQRPAAETSQRRQTCGSGRAVPWCCRTVAGASAEAAALAPAGRLPAAARARAVAPLRRTSAQMHVGEVMGILYINGVGRHRTMQDWRVMSQPPPGRRGNRRMPASLL